MAIRGTPPKPPKPFRKATLARTPALNADAETPVESEEPDLARFPNAPARAGLRRGALGFGEERKGGGDQEGASERARIGDETVDASTLGGLSVMLASQHLMLLLAKKRAKAERAETLRTVGDLVLGLEDPAFVKRVLLGMGEAGRIVDVYPLEVMAYVLERRPELLEGIQFAPFVRNREEVEGRPFEVEEEIKLDFSVSLRMRAFALAGGGSPGYCLAPGGPGSYTLELGGPGTFDLLLRAEARKESLIDRLRIQVVDAPGSD